MILYHSSLYRDDTHMPRHFTTYHSTTDDNIPGILENGFEPRFGQNYGLTFGDGIYTTSSMLYASTYNIESNKLLVCEIVTDNVREMTLKEYIRLKKKHVLDSFDLVIITDCDEYISKNLNTIRVVDVVQIERKFNGSMLDEVSVV